MARLNENENENEGTGSNRDGLFAGGRYNTYKIAKQAFDPNPKEGSIARAPVLCGYDQMGGWDAENKAWIYLVEFTKFRANWFDELRDVAQKTWDACDLLRDARALDRALRDIADAAGEREDRFAECFHQQGADGCISYWLAMLRIDPGKQPNTNQLIRVGRKLGELIVMCLKAHFNVPRASQICPAIVPMFDPPRTASYPAGHSLQSYLISYLLRRVVPGLPQSDPPGTWEEMHEGLFALARRVADNRVVAGVHYDIDSKGGFLIAKTIDGWLDTWCGDWFDAWVSDDGAPKKAGELAAFADLLKAARKEFPQFNKTR